MKILKLWKHIHVKSALGERFFHTFLIKTQIIQDFGDSWGWILSIRSLFFYCFSNFFLHFPDIFKSKSLFQIFPVRMKTFVQLMSKNIGHFTQRVLKIEQIIALFVEPRKSDFFNQYASPNFGISLTSSLGEWSETYSHKDTSKWYRFFCVVNVPLRFSFLNTNCSADVGRLCLNLV